MATSDNEVLRAALGVLHDEIKMAVKNPSDMNLKFLEHRVEILFKMISGQKVPESRIATKTSRCTECGCMWIFTEVDYQECVSCSIVVPIL